MQQENKMSEVSKMISKAELTSERLSAVLGSAYMENVIDDDDHIYVTGGVEFPMWIALQKASSIIRIFTYVTFRDEDVSDDLAFALVNRMNMDYIPNQVYRVDNALYSAYSIFPIDGISERAFVEAVRRCSSAFTAGVRECDDDDLIG
jgi:hypothetical protein